MSRKPLVLFGAGELAEVAAYYFETDSDREIVAFTVDGAHIKEDSFLGRPVIPFESLAESMRPASHDLFIATGYSKVNALRREKCEAGRAAGYDLASYISSKAFVAGNAVIGWNAFVLEDNTVQPFVRIGNGVTLWSGNHIGHHVRIGDYAFISSHVVLSGGVTVGEQTFMGVNATTNDHISIGARCVIGSGALLVKNVPDEAVMLSKPAEMSPVPSSKLRGF
jgi:sugar O-acyltransferase (sialic acid O-acetyltransferase NeuD family)